MILYIASALLAIAASTAQDAGVPVTTSSELANALSTLSHAVAVYSTIDSPLEHCFSAELTTLRPEDQLAVYVYHIESPLGYIEVPPFCINLNTSASGEFLFGPCGECMMGVTTEFKDSVPEECVQQFDQHCGPKRYTLYNKEECA
ncbi:hypothetical protein MTO96_050805 [Rhipicephalus appendiculatus]